ncbi:site-2 protease family protein [Actinomadura craniellae]|uniref:site-2 protease family protein n=1 Tax=Actinomadura craniellae TaxID=2231787 RepID=UPI001F170FB9|nr:site-2 protease family protein [Actinomadura craniellae]
MADSTPDPGREHRRPGLLVGRPFGIPVYVSPSWFLVAFLITVLFEYQVRDVASAPFSHLIAFAYAVLLYASVFVHELSHAVTARAMGLPVRAVTLHILGGDTAIERESPTPGRDFLIAFAGPVVNLVLAAIGLLVHLLVPLPPVARLLVDALTIANLLVGLFNLLPGLPLDGGRLVRAAVWKITGRARDGTIVAGWVGRGVALLTLAGGALLASQRTTGGGYGWLALLWSALIASFIWVGASSAIQNERLRERIPLLNARRLARRATLVPGDTPLAEAIRRAQADGSGALVIADHDGTPTALVSEQAVHAVPEQRRPWTLTSEISRSLTPGLTLDADLAGEDLLQAVQQVQATEYLLVEPDGRIYGVLSLGDLDREFSGA